MNAIRKNRGQYLGTEIDHKWWQRYSKGEFFTRGMGEYWIKDGALFFQHRSGQTPIRLPIRDIVEIALCPWERRTWSGCTPIIKLVWRKDGRWLSSVFALSGDPEETSGLIARLRTSV